MPHGADKAPVDDPIARFRDLFDRACGTGMVNPNAMVLSTRGAGGGVSSRVVLLKEFDERGFVFYTNLESRKAIDLSADPAVSLNFYWREIGRQVSIEGTVEPVSPEEADAYFATRPRQSQLGAWVSRQSRPLSSRFALLREVVRTEARHLGRSIPRPPHWSGFRVLPSRIEFWVEGPFRLHDRTLFEKADGGWSAIKLYP
jgi:pyridoxamine 5'-phosphate oxidase